MEYFQMHDVIEFFDNIISSTMSPHLDPLREFDIGSPPPPPCIPKKPPYNLRSMTKKSLKGEVIGGLESNPILVGPRKMQGTKSNLSKAQVKEKIDIVDGKQLSLSGVLRVAQAPYLSYK